MNDEAQSLADAEQLDNHFPSAADISSFPAIPDFSVRGTPKAQLAAHDVWAERKKSL